MVDEECIGRGKGNTKKAAQNEAAKEGLAKLGVHVVRPSFSPPLRVTFVDAGSSPSRRFVAHPRPGFHPSHVCYVLHLALKFYIPGLLVLLVI